MRIADGVAAITSVNAAGRAQKMYVWPVYHEGKVAPIKPVEARRHDIAATPSFSAYDSAREAASSFSVDVTYNASGQAVPQIRGAETGRHLDFYA